MIRARPRKNQLPGLSKQCAKRDRLSKYLAAAAGRVTEPKMTKRGREEPAAPSEFGPRWGRWIGRFMARIMRGTNVAGKEGPPTNRPVVRLAHQIGVFG